jgi:hypothetical protein
VKYHVSIPIKGTSTFEVEAADDEAAKQAAWDAIDEGTNGDVTWEYFEDPRTGDEVDVMPQEKRATPKRRRP